jgi:hypothetical protein
MVNSGSKGWSGGACMFVVPQVAMGPIYLNLYK